VKEGKLLNTVISRSVIRPEINTLNRARTKEHTFRNFSRTGLRTAKTNVRGGISFRNHQKLFPFSSRVCNVTEGGFVERNGHLRSFNVTSSISVSERPASFYRSPEAPYGGKAEMSSALPRRTLTHIIEA